jgi:hypothetical protein
MSAWKAYPEQRRQIATIPSGPPIFVTGTHRSGTTWVAQMLSVPGIWHVHEPFNPNKGMWKESFTYASPDREVPAVDAMLKSLLRGGRRRALNIPNSQHPWMPLRWSPLRPRRLLLKDPLACLLTGYLARHFHLKTLVIFRHPCGFVSSVQRLGWPTAGYLRAFLERQDLMQEHLHPYAELMRRYSQTDSVESAAVLHGVLNQVLWNQTQQFGLRWMRFEDLCTSPIEEFHNLFEWCGLPYDDHTRRFHEALSLSEPRPVEDYHTHAVQRNSQAASESWRKYLTADALGRIGGIWMQFSIPLYEAKAHWNDASREAFEPLSVMR